MRKVNLLATFVLISLSPCFSQGLLSRFGLRLTSYSTRYTFSSPGDPYHNAKVNSQSTFGGGLIYNLQLHKEFRIQTGLDYFSSNKTPSDSMYIKGNAANPNSKGYLTLTTDCSYLLIPVEAVWMPLAGKEIRPFFSAGVTAFIPLHEQLTLNFKPSKYNGFYSLDPPPTTTVSGDKINEAFGFSFGAGLILKTGQHESEFSLRVRYLKNKSIYSPAIVGTNLENHYQFNNSAIEFSAGYTFQLGKR